MKKTASIILAISLLLTLSMSAYAAAPTNLTWDGKAATLSELAKNVGQDMVDANGNYKPLYYYHASELWNNGLFLGSDGSFDLDNPLTRAEGVVMTVRILGKDAEAKATAASVTFTDVPDWAKPYVAYAVQNGIANGYNATTFGSSDPMTAAQFITLTLRAMGYQDGTDFTWDKSYDKALEIGLIGQPCHAQYSRSNLFMRDNAAVIAYNALFSASTKAGGKLSSSVTMPGKPSGTVPTAVKAVPAPVEVPSGGIVIEITSAYAAKPYVRDDGKVERGELVIDFTVISGSGTLEYSITGHSGPTSNFSTTVDEGENYRIFRRYDLSLPFTGSSDPFILTWSGGGVERTISVTNTNWHGKIELVW